MVVAKFTCRESMQGVLTHASAEQYLVTISRGSEECGLTAQSACNAQVDPGVTNVAH